jgi:hypothetical protein
MGWILAKIDQRWILLIIGVLCAVSGLAEAQASPPLTRAEKEEFLRTAEQRVPPPGPRHDRGDPPAFRTLTDGHLSHRVDFNSLDLYRSGVTVLADGTRMFGFRDSYRYTIAAYELDKLLGLNMVLVSVGRDLDGKTGAVTWVLEDVRMTANGSSGSLASRRPFMKQAISSTSPGSSRSIAISTRLSGGCHWSP